MPRGGPPLTMTVGGETLTLKQWAAKTGIRVRTLDNRLRNHWPPEKVVDTPLMTPVEKGRIGGPKKAIKERY
jgi:hypothetical protein